MSGQQAVAQVINPLQIDVSVYAGRGQVLTECFYYGRIGILPSGWTSSYIHWPK